MPGYNLPSGDLLGGRYLQTMQRMDGALCMGGDDPISVRKAMKAVNASLVLPDAQIIQLLILPFDTSDLEPDYIKGYLTRRKAKERGDI